MSNRVARTAMITASLMGAALAWLGHVHATASTDDADAPVTFHNVKLFAQGDAPVHVGRAPAGTGTADAESCGQCHAEIAQEWRQSQHAEAWTDEVFQVAYAVEPMAFCRNCHAPRIAPGAKHPDALAVREGVSCAVCHVREGTVLSNGAHRSDIASASQRAPHPVTALPAMSSSAFCAGCHQFNFPVDPGPGMPLYSRDEAMQNTFREWQDSVHAEVGTQCQDCHMPWKTAANGRRYRSHAFPGGRDPAMIARAIQLSVRVEPTRDAVVLHANVSAGMTGHAFPTGDLFRRGELTVWIEGEPSLSRTVSFARDFADVMERAPGTHAITFVRHQVGDSRLPAPGTGAPAEYTLTVPVPASAWRPEMRVRWAVDHLLMPSPMAASQGVGTARNRVRVLEGSAVVTRPGEAP